ncbi:MAG: hypothetical protein Q7S21_02710 [archaeon]|nr:hypothetical protein [archaeon]
MILVKSKDKKKVSRQMQKAIADIREANKNPEFRKFIKEFVKYHTGPKYSK